jgi:hypothetical protein
LKPISSNSGIGRSVRSARVSALDTEGVGLARLRGDVVAIRGQRPALTGGDALASVEGEAGGVAEAAGRASLVGGAGGAGGVLDEPQAVRVGDGLQLGVVGALAEHVDGHDTDRPIGDGSFDRSRVDGPGVRPDVGEDRPPAGVDHGVTGGREGVVGDDDLVPGAHAERGEGQVERGRAIADRQRVRPAGHAGKLVPEARPGGAVAGDPTGTEHLFDRAELLLAEARLAEGDDRQRARDQEAPVQGVQWAGAPFGAGAPRSPPPGTMRRPD